jgi:hypothetical protein
VLGEINIKSHLNIIKFDYLKGRGLQSNPESITIWLHILIKAGNFLYNSQTWHEIKWLWLRSLTHLIKWVGLGLTYIYICLNTIWILHTTYCLTWPVNPIRTQYKIRWLELKSLTRLIKWFELGFDAANDYGKGLWPKIMAKTRKSW